MSNATRAVALVLFVASTACSPSTAPPPSGAPAQGQPTEARAAAVTATCMEILQCLGPCGSDAACFAACEQKGDEPTLAQVQAVLECVTACNNDQSCISVSCATQLGACQAAGAPAAAAPQPGTTGDLLPSMVGEWVSATYSFEFRADGTVRRSLGVASGAGCASTTTASGPVTQDGDVLTMDLAPEVAKNCTTTVGGGGPQRVRYRVDQVDVNGRSVLRLRDLDCTKGSDLYCAELLERR